MKKIIFFVAGLLCVIGLVFGIGYSEKFESYEKVENGTLGDSLWSEDKSKHMQELVNKNSVKLKNSTIDTGKYLVTLEEYFYEKSVPFVIYQCKITQQDGTTLTEAQYREFKQEHDKDNIHFHTGLGATSVMDKVYQDEEGNTIWQKAFLIDPDGIDDKIYQFGEERIYKIKNKNYLQELNLYGEEGKMGEFLLPQYGFEAKSVSFDTSKNTKVKSIQVSEFGICIVWDLTDILEEFKEMLKSLPQGTDTEKYGYEVYENITLTMKDGQKLTIDEMKTEMTIGDKFGIYEENKLASFNALWNEDVNLEKIRCITIDGVSYSVEKEQ